jgi:hypothetical protein
MIKRLFGDWELKLVSLVVAVALWIYTSGQVRVERVATIAVRPESVAGLSAQLQVVQITPAEFTVVLSVPVSRLDELRLDRPEVRLRVDREHLRPGPVEFPLTAHALGLDSDLTIVRSEPADLRGLTVVLGRVAEETLAVELPPVIGLPPGGPATVEPELSRVHIRGDEDARRQLVAEGQRVRFRPVELSGVDPALAAEHSERVALEPLPSPYTVLDRVAARIVLRPARELTSELQLDVQVLLAPEQIGRWRLDPERPQVTVRVSGPENLVRGLRADEVTAWVDLRRPPASGVAEDLAVVLRAPPWLRSEPARVRLALRLAAEPVPAPEPAPEPAAKP